MFFSISYTFMNWLFKKRLDKYTFRMTDDKYPNYLITVTVERKKIDDKD